MNLKTRLITLFIAMILFNIVEGQDAKLEIQSNVPIFELKTLITKDITPEKGTTEAAFSNGNRKIIEVIETISTSSDGSMTIQLPEKYFERQFRDSIFLTAPGFAPIRSPNFKANKLFKARFSPYPTDDAISQLVYDQRQPCIAESAVPLDVILNGTTGSYTRDCILQDTLTQWPLLPFNYQKSVYNIENFNVYRLAFATVFANIQSSKLAQFKYGNQRGIETIKRNAGIEYLRLAILPLIQEMWDTQPYLEAFAWTTDEHRNDQFLNYFKCLREGESRYSYGISSIDCRNIQPPQFPRRWQWQLTPPVPNYQTDPYSSIIDSISTTIQSQADEHPIAQYFDLTTLMGTLETYSIWSSMNLEDLQKECWTNLDERRPTLDGVRPKCELFSSDRKFWTTLDQLVYLDIVQHKIKAVESQPLEIKWDQFSCFETDVSNPAYRSLTDVSEYYYRDLANEIVNSNLNQFLSTTDSIPELLAVISEYQIARESYYDGRSSTALNIKLRLDSTNASAFWKALEYMLNQDRWSYQKTYPNLSVTIRLEDPSFRDILKTDYRIEQKELLALLNTHYKSSRPDLACGELAETLLEEYNIQEEALWQFNCIDISQLPEITFSKPSSVRVSQSNQVISLTDTIEYRLIEARQHFTESFVNNSMSDNGGYIDSSDLFPIIDQEAPHSARLIALQGDGVTDMIPGDYSISASFFTQGDTVHLSLIRALSNPSTSNVLDIDAAEWNQSLSKGQINISITNTLSGSRFDRVSNAHLTILTKEGKVEPLLMYEARRIRTSSIWNSLSDNATEDRDFIQSYGTLRDEICNLIVLTEDLTLNQHLLQELSDQNKVISVPATTMDSLRSTVVSLSKRINDYADSYASRKADFERAQEEQEEEDALRQQKARAELERNFSRWKSSNQVYANPDGFYSCESVSGTLKIEYNRWQFEGLSKYYSTEYASGTVEKNGNSSGEIGTLRVVDSGYDVGWGGSLNLELDNQDYPNGRNGWVLYVDFDGHPLVSRSICYKQ